MATITKTRLGILVVVVASGVLLGLRARSDHAPSTPAEARDATRPTLQAERNHTAGQPKIQLDDDPHGTLRLEGMVVGLEDRPVAGVHVTISSIPPRTVTTEDDGSFAFDDLIVRPYEVIARGEHGVAGPVIVQLVETTEPVILKLRPGGTLNVSVRRRDGKPVAGAHVELRGLEDRDAVIERDRVTFDQVVPGDYELVGWHDGTARTTRALSIAAGPTTAELVLEAGFAVRGRVVSEPGEPIAGARVRALSGTGWGAPGERDGVITGADGRFELAALPAGSIRVEATHGDFAPATSELIVLGATTPPEITLTLRRGAVVRGRVIESNKVAVPFARIRILEVRAQGLPFEPVRQTYADGDGKFELRGLAHVQHTIVALHDRGASPGAAADTTVGDIQELVLVIDAGATISGVVVDPAGEPIANTSVAARPRFDAAIDLTQWRLRGFPEVLTDGAGRFALTGLAPGGYLVEAWRGARTRIPMTRGRATPANTGDTNVRIVLAAPGSLRARVAFADGQVPALYTASVSGSQQTFATPDLLLTELEPGPNELSIRGPEILTRVVPVVIEPARVVDLGTIIVRKGRSLTGIVTARGQPVAGAKVYAGRMIMGTGTTASASLGPMGGTTKQVTTGEDGRFSLSGFPGGDLAIVADHEEIGRSQPTRIPSGRGDELELVIVPHASLSGTLRQAGSPIGGVMVSCQSTAAAGALSTVRSGSDGSFRFDRLGADTYKVSATVGMPITGMKLYSKQVTLAAGQHATVNLEVEPGTVTVELRLTAERKIGAANTYLIAGSISAKTHDELALALANAGDRSQWLIVREGEPVTFTEVRPGPATVCAVPFPIEVSGIAIMSYLDRHGDTLAAHCRAIEITTTPATQSVALPVVVPPKIEDPEEPPASGSGSGSAMPPGAGSGPPPPESP